MSLHIEKIVKKALSPPLGWGKKVRDWATRNKVGVLLTLLSFFVSFSTVTWHLRSTNTPTPEVASVVVVSTQPSAPPVSTVIVSSTQIVQPPPPKAQAVRGKTSTVVVTSVVTAPPVTVTSAASPARASADTKQSVSERPDVSPSLPHPDSPSVPSQAQGPEVAATTSGPTP